MKEKLKKLEQIPIDKIVIRAFASWCFAALFSLFKADGKFSELESFANVSLVFFICVFVVFFALLTIIDLLKKNWKADIYALPVGFALYSFVTLLSCGKDWYFAFCLIALAGIMIFYYAKKGYLDKKALSDKRTVIMLTLTGVFFILVVGLSGVLRYLSYNAPNFDFGIFCNMYYNMTQSFKPLTTCERDTLLSHFAVHVSPIYYLLLPIFYVFPSGSTLQMMQAVILGSAVIPLCLIAKHYKLSNIKILLLGIMVLLHPAVAGGTSYDFHENCFLLPLLLWVFYFFEKEKYIPMSVFVLLTLFVKEDAAVYIIFFAIYVILSKRKYLVGACLAVSAAVYFIVVLTYLDSFGDGVMSGRYSNFIIGDGGLFEVVKNVLVDPAFVFTQIFVDKNGEYAAKLLFILQMFVPLAFIPFATKKVSRLLLLLPMVLLNLMTVYVYQYDIGFQYAFGSTAFLVYLTVLNAKDMKPFTAKVALPLGVVAASMLFLLVPVTKCTSYFANYVSYSDNYSIMNEALAQIPEEASVICSTRLVAHLANRTEIYEVHYHEVREGEQVDFVILDTHANYDEFLEQYQTLGYEITDIVKNAETDKTLLYILEPSNE